MDQETLKRLDALAQVLQTTTAHLWQVLVAQAKVAIIQDVVLFFIGVVLLSIGKRFYQLMNESDNFGYVLAFALPTIAGSILAIFALSNIWTPLMNPEFYALSVLLRKLGK